MCTQLPCLTQLSDSLSGQSQMYIISITQAGPEFQYSLGHFKVPIISAYAKILLLIYCFWAKTC